MAEYREPQEGDELECPVCPYRVEVSPEDPDCSLSEMHGHLRWNHPEHKVMELLAKVRLIPVAAS